MKKIRIPHTVRRGSTSVKIYWVARKSGQTVFAVAWYAGGQRKTQQYSNFAKALDQAQLTADQLNAGKINVAASLTVDDVELLRAARRICGETPILSALEQYGKAVELVGGDVLAACRAWADANTGNVRKISFSDAVDRFIAAKRRQGVEIKNYANNLPRLKSAFKDRSISSISACEVEKAIHETFAVGDNKLCHPGTFNSIRK